MKNVFCFLNSIRLVIVLVLCIFASCKKNNLYTPAVASLTVTNAIIGAPPIRVGSIVTQVANNSSAQLSVLAGDNDLYVWPLGDSAKPYYTNSKFSADDHGVYSLFLAGQLPNVTGIVLQENIPYHVDSTCGIRIVNLSPNSPPLNITLSTAPTANQVSNLAYLQYTDFKLYPAKAGNVSYTFQFRKASDNTILASIGLNPTPRFANVTLVFRGLVGGAGAQAIGVTRVNNDR